MTILFSSFGTGLNIDAFDVSVIGQGVLTQADQNAITAILPSGGDFSLSGSFTYSGGTLSAGTVTSVDFSDPGDPGSFHASFTNFSAIEAATWLVAGNTQAALNALLGGNDTITGDSGHVNLLRGLSGDDDIYMVGNNPGTDSMFGGTGNDTISDGTTGGNHYLRGDDGNDLIIGASGGFDDINGNKGNDTIDGGAAGNDWLVGGQGDDLITAHAGQNILYGNLGDDTLHAGSGGDLMRGGQGNDSIVGGAGNDWISGDRGNDTISGGGGADTFHTFSGAGLDRVLDFHLAEGDRVQVDAGTHYTVTQLGADTVIDMGGGDQMVLVGVQMSTLTTGWIFAL